MKIEVVDFFYAAMPQVTLEADGSQDALLVRVAGDDGSFGWGECEASPLTSIAAFVTPRSHGVCQPVSASVIGRVIKTPEDISSLSSLVSRNSMDLLQAAHVWSGIEIALWDLLGKKLEEPIWRLLGYSSNFAKTPYASMLMGEDVNETYNNVIDVKARGFNAIKIGWGPYGRGNPSFDAEHVLAAREGIGADGKLLIDAGQIFGDNIESASARIPALEKADVTWLEEPFSAHSFASYAELAKKSNLVGLAGGEAAHCAEMAINLIEFGDIAFIQVDAARIGGISAAKKVADHAVRKGIKFVNHTFTSHLALSASMQAFVGLEEHRLCEYPAFPKQLSFDLSKNHIIPDKNGEIFAPDKPGLGIDLDIPALEPYLRKVEILVDDNLIFSSPDLK